MKIEWEEEEALERIDEVTKSSSVVYSILFAVYIPEINRADQAAKHESLQRIRRFILKIKKLDAILHAVHTGNISLFSVDL